MLQTDIKGENDHLKLPTEAGLASTACPRGISGLKHEVLDDPVELHGVSSALLTLVCLGGYTVCSARQEAGV